MDCWLAAANPAIYGKLIKEQRPRRWVKQFREYLGELGLDFSDVERMSLESIVGRVNSCERSKWRRDIESKATLDLHRNKCGIEDERIYSNGLWIWVSPVVPVQNQYTEAQMETEV